MKNPIDIITRSMINKSKWVNNDKANTQNDMISQISRYVIYGMIILIVIATIPLWIAPALFILLPAYIALKPSSIGSTNNSRTTNVINDTDDDELYKIESDLMFIDNEFNNNEWYGTKTNPYYPLNHHNEDNNIDFDDDDYYN
jgi:hypothetical protein